MTQPILSLAAANAPSVLKATPHLLPCHIHHDGSVEPVAEQFWAPTTSSSTNKTTDSTNTDTDKKTAYFRGRKLQSRTLRLPPDYRGIVAVPPPKQTEEDEQEVDTVDLTNESPSGAKSGDMRVLAEFEEVVVWNHEGDGADKEGEGDPYVRGVEEWLGIAEQVRKFYGLLGLANSGRFTPLMWMGRSRWYGGGMRIIIGRDGWKTTSGALFLHRKRDVIPKGTGFGP
jgi:ribonuclease H2 subunit C